MTRPAPRLTDRRIDLPWPPQALHPNARVHWGARAKAAKQARASAAWIARAAGIGRIEAEALRVVAVFAPPNKHHRDEDGMLSSIKSYLDGIADVIGVDDSKWRIEIRREAPCPGGNVRIEIYPVDTWEHISEPVSRVIDSMPLPKREAS